MLITLVMNTLRFLFLGLPEGNANTLLLRKAEGELLGLDVLARSQDLAAGLALRVKE